MKILLSLHWKKMCWTKKISVSWGATFICYQLNTVVIEIIILIWKK